MPRLAELRKEDGQVLVIVALSLSALMLFLGLAIDIGKVRLEKRRLQNAADAVALAASLEGRVCGSNYNCSAMKSAAVNAMKENGYTVAASSAGCTFASSDSLSVTVNQPPCMLGSDPNRGKSNYVEAILTESVPTYFARLGGFKSFHISARAEAGRGLGGPCIYALNPTAWGAFNIVAGVGFRANCGIVIESNSWGALTCLIGVLMSAPDIRITGGVASLLCGLSTWPTTGAAVPTPADPLAYLSPPPGADDPCGSGSGNTYYGSSTPVSLILVLGQKVTFNPGVYCGGISITAAVLSYIVFNPGIYIFRNGHYTVLGIPGIDTSGLTLTIGALSVLQGNGVMFYNEGDGGSFSLTALSPLLGLTSINLTAPTSGAYGGLLFFQAHGITNTGTFLVSVAEGGQLNGGIYMPDALVSYGVSVLNVAHNYNFLVADRIQFTAAILSTFSNDYSSLQNGSPLNGDTSFLVQ